MGFTARLRVTVGASGDQIEAMFQKFIMFGVSVLHNVRKVTILDMVLAEKRPFSL